MRSRALVGVLVGIALLSGCSKEPGETRYRVSGEVKFNGRPIPYGTVNFTPDGAKQNSGPQGTATIKDGKFDTSAAEGKGFAGGPTLVRVAGLAGPNGPALCEYEYTVDLPRGDTTLNIEVPATAVPKKAGPEI